MWREARPPPTACGRHCLQSASASASASAADLSWFSDMRNVFVILNPVAGKSDASAIRRALEHRFVSGTWAYEVYETTGEERIADVVRAALDRGFDMFVAAGGDGTVSGVASGLARRGIPMGIIPVGTGNALARELGIPVSIEGALALLTERHDTVDIDAIRTGDRFFVLNLGVGISALTMRDTERQDKRQFGVIAYIWTGVSKLFGVQPHRFTVEVDGQTVRVHASEIAVANSGAMGDPSFRWGPDVRLDDGRLDVCIVRARTAIDYLRVTRAVLLGQQRRSPNIHCLSAERNVSISSDRPLPVQADGELIGHTPVQMELVPGAVRVIVPATDDRRQVLSFVGEK